MVNAHAASVKTWRQHLVIMAPLTAQQKKKKNGMLDPNVAERDDCIKADVAHFLRQC